MWQNRGKNLFHYPVALRRCPCGHLKYVNFKLKIIHLIKNISLFFLHSGLRLCLFPTYSLNILKLKVSIAPFVFVYLAFLHVLSNLLLSTCHGKNIQWKNTPVYVEEYIISNPSRYCKCLGN